jgi:sigma-B regulation protein RsbU (phosphoserine phosphatase)
MTKPNSHEVRTSAFTRSKKFWRRISDGVAIQQLWLQLHGEARSSYRLYSNEVDWERGENETRGQNFKRIVTGLFWAMILKLSPGRRVLFLIALILLVFPGFDLSYHGVEIQMHNLSFFGALVLLVLLALELADRVTMKRDLEIAKQIQTWLMPSSPPEVAGIEVAFETRPANTVAGDYYDAFLRPVVGGITNACPPLLLIVADVAGKSVPAALLMATLQASLHTLADMCATPLELVERLNRYAYDQNIGGQRFTTAFLAQLDPLTHELTYVNAGHNYPVLRRTSGLIERLETGGVPLGILRGSRYELGKVRIMSGDLLLIFTDGLVEAENDHQEEYGEFRMLDTLNSSSGISAAEVLRRLMTSADQFVGSTAQVFIT